jgi:hypothetical protein
MLTQERTMRRKMAVGFLVLMTALAGAQTTASNAPAEVIANGGLIHTLMAAPVTGQPYSAVQVRQIKKVLADGTTISHHGHHSVARDSSGRVRVERRMEEAQNGQPETVMVFVLDPVAQTMTIWTTGPKTTKAATLIRLPEKKGAGKPAATQQRTAEDSRPQPVVTTEDLAPDTLQGLPVTVRKVTTVVPAGRSGNDAPITKTHETWTSPDLKLVMKEQWEDPRSGVQTVELDQFSRAEPDAALFRAPAGYSVKDVRQTLKELQERLDQMMN